MVAAFLVDDFNDNSLDATKWNTAGGSGYVAETSSRLETSAVTAGVTTAVHGLRYYDLVKGVLAIKLSKVSGSPNGNLHTYFGITDGTNQYTIIGNTNTAVMATSVNNLGSGTASNPDTTVGLGPTFTNGTWIGWWWNPGTGILSMGRSATGSSWTTMHRYTITSPPGSFKFKRASLIVGMKNLHSGATNLVDAWDDFTYFATETELRVSARYSSAWTPSTVKVRQAGAWVRVVPKVRSGGIWVQPS